MRVSLIEDSATSLKTVSMAPLPCKICGNEAVL